MEIDVEVESVNSVPPIMGWKDRVTVAWSVLRGNYNTGLNRTGRGQLYRFKPYVLQAVFESGDRVLMQTGLIPGDADSTDSYSKAARRELVKRAPWVGNPGPVVYMRLIRRSDWGILVERGGL